MVSKIRKFWNCGFRETDGGREIKKAQNRGEKTDVNN